MREDYHEIQTPKKEQLLSSNRKTNKLINSTPKKQQKIVKKNLNSVFALITEDDVVLDASDKISLMSEPVEADLFAVDASKSSLSSEYPEESLISEDLSLKEDQSSESIESYIVSLSQYISPSSAMSRSIEVTPFSFTSPAESTPLSSILTVEMTPLSSPITSETAGVSRDGAITLSSISNAEMTPLSSPETAAVFVASGEPTTEEMNSFKLESLVKHLRESMFQVLHSADIDPRYKKVLDALVKVIIEELYSLHEEKNIVDELFSTPVKIVLLSFVLGVLFVSAGGFFLFSDAQSSYHGPPPT